MSWILPAVFAAIGAAKAISQNVSNKGHRKAQAVTTQWSPWTGMKADAPPGDENALGGAMQGMMAGMMMGKNGNSMFGGKEAADLANDPDLNTWALMNDQQKYQPPSVEENFRYRPTFKYGSY